jgi:hypothetical protein
VTNIGAEHVIRISTDEDGREVEILHPEECRKESVWDGMADQYTCGIAVRVAEFGTDYFDGDTKDGLYLAQFWATPGDWAGPNPIDPEDGIELTRLVES